MTADRTPSPAPDRGFCRQRSPWTAPRDRKRNRGAQDPCLPKLIESDASEGDENVEPPTGMKLCWEHSPPRRKGEALPQGASLSTASVFDIPHSSLPSWRHAAHPPIGLPQWGPSAARLKAHPLTLAKQAALHHSADFEEPSSSMRAALHELAKSGSGSDMTAFCPSALRGPHRMLAMPPIQQDDMLTAQQPSSLCHRAGSTSCPSLQGAGSVWPAGWGCRAAADPIASVEPETGVACPIEQCQAQYRRSRGTSSSADSWLEDLVSCGGRDESVQDHDEADRPARSPEQADADVLPHTSATWVAHALEDAFAGLSMGGARQLPCSCLAHASPQGGPPSTPLWSCAFSPFSDGVSERQSSGGSSPIAQPALRDAAQVHALQGKAVARRLQHSGERAPLKAPGTRPDAEAAPLSPDLFTACSLPERQDAEEASEHLWLAALSDPSAVPDVDALNQLLRSKCRLGGLPQRGEAEQVIRMACLGGHIAPSLATMEALARVNLQLEQLHGPAC